MPRDYSLLDRLIIRLQKDSAPSQLMRINHSGEVCAQALYHGQAATTRDPVIKQHLLKAAHEEQAHLDWCANRIDELASHTSYLNPFWYIGSFSLGAMAGLLDPKWGLGFVAETEKQVEQHLDKHLDLLDKNDDKTRQILEQMKADEIQHANDAIAKGAAELPGIVKELMRSASRVMTGIAKYI